MKVDIINKPEDIKDTEAKRVKNLFKKYKKILGSEIKRCEFKEPVLFFIRQNNEVEFYEKVTAGLFNFKHSDGNDRYIIIHPKYQMKFGVGKFKYRGYICHENHPYPIPEEPLMSSEQMNIIVEKSLNDMKKYKAQEIKAKAGLIKAIAVVCAVIIGGIILYVLLKPNNPTSVQTISNVGSMISNGTHVFGG